MSLTLYNSIGWAVEKQTITAGGGLTGPVLVSAVSTDPNTVRLTFDRKLMLEYRQTESVYHAKTLDIASFGIVKVSDATPLEVVRTIWISDTVIDLATANQQAFVYRVTCVAGGVMDFQGNVITLQTADFTGQQRTTYTTPSDIRLFTSGYPGMQEDLTEDFYPDLEAPYLANQNPMPSDTGVSVSTHVQLDVLDADEGVALATVLIYVGGSLAYRGDTDTFLAPYNGPSSARSVQSLGYRFVIDRTSDYPQFAVITVAVYAEDNAAIPNVLDTTYNFQIEDNESPYLENLDPYDTETEVARTSNVILDVVDDGSGVDAASVVIKVGGVTAWQSEAAQSGFAVTRIPLSNGHTYIINPNTDFGSYQTVLIEVQAQDNATVPNTLDTSYSFRTIDTVAPYLSNLNPFSGETGVHPRTNVQIEVLDAGTGVQASSVVLRVNGTIAWQADAQQPGFVVTKQIVPLGYRYTIDPAGPLPVYTNTIRVVAQDLAAIPNALDTSYTFEVTDTVLPRILNMEPRGPGQVPNVAVSFHSDDDIQVVLASIQVTIDDVSAVINGVIQAGWTGTIVPNIEYGYDVSLQKIGGFLYGTDITARASVADGTMIPVTETWSFSLIADPACFTGPLNTFETSLLVPYDYAGSKLYYTEQLRSFLINAVTSRPDPVKAIRQIFLRTYMTDLASVLRNLVPAPTASEKLATLCYKRTVIEIDADLRRKPGLLKAALTELKGLGLPVEHSQLLWSYMRTNQPNDLVPLACLIVCLAKALEKNELS